MRYSSEFFYGFNGKTNNFKISDEDIQKIKKLKSHRSDQSGYYDVMLQWRLSDNLDIVSDEEELSHLYVCMQFISMVSYINLETKDYNKYLLRRLYLEFDDYDDPCITMGFKRPFGNSNVLGDVRDVIDIFHPLSQKEKESDEYDREEEVLLEFIDFLDNFFRSDFELKHQHFTYLGKRYLSHDKPISSDWSYLDYKHAYLFEWIFDKNEVRDSKLEKILN